MKLAITSQNLDHAPDAIRALRAERTAAGSRSGLRRQSTQDQQTATCSIGRDAYFAAIQDAMRNGRNPVSDVDMPFRPDHEPAYIPRAPERSTRWSEALQTWITS